MIPWEPTGGIWMSYPDIVNLIGVYIAGIAVGICIGMDSK